MGLIYERWYPSFWGIVSGLIYYFSPPLSGYVIPETASNLLAAVVSAGGIAVGFLATAKSILISIDEKPIIQRMKDAGIYRRVLGYMREGIKCSFILTIFSAAALIVSFKDLKADTWTTWHRLGVALWIGFAVAAVLSYVRIAKIWYTVLDKIDTKQP